MKSDHRPSELRLEMLRGRVMEKGFVSVAATAQEFGVSEMTIRRDLDRLEQQNVAIRTHGGAIAKGGLVGRTLDLEEPAFDGRSRTNADAKTAIARIAALIPQPHQTVGLDVGSTTLELARHLDDRRELKIFTNSLRAAMALSDGGHQVYLPGGQVRAIENSVCGSIAVNQLRNYWLDHAFIGVSGITEAGCFDYSLEETEVKQVYLERASNVVVLCDSSKFGHLSLVQVCELSRINILVTNAAPPPRLTEALTKAGVQISFA